MIRRPKLHDWQIVGLYTGKIIVGIGLLMLVPLAVGLLALEWSAVVDFIIGILVAMSVGYGLQMVCETKHEMNWMHGMVIAAFSWLLAMGVGAVPHYLSGQFGSFLDACFDLMSGYTTTGLYLLQDLDHTSNALNMWRHLLTYAGGQGIVVIALTFLIRGTSGAFMMYVGEGKDEKLLPNVVQTARAIWLVSLTYLVIGTVTIGGANWLEGMNPVRAFLHGVWVFMGAWSTGGFAPQSYNIGYYHSLAVEVLTMIMFIIGSFNFALHWSVWTGNRREIYRNIEIVSFMVTIFLTVSLGTYALMQVNALHGVVPFFRKAFYQIASGHTTTGFMTIYSRQFVRQWGVLAMIATTIAMAIGGSAASTAGGFKGMRMGIIAKSFLADIRRLMLPESSVIVKKIHHVKDTVLSDDQVRAAMAIVLAYIFIYLTGAVLGALYRYPFVEALFESVSAGSNSGLSVGITAPSMPTALKVYYIFAEWAGRLEFMAVFALTGFIIRVVKGK
ncbi:MAG: TrkH family potassium uptake protein [Actinomycetota bacterium]|nr:TrkH family potassium uptake protein [Actinomycetota bacterium]